MKKFSVVVASVFFVFTFLTLTAAGQMRNTAFDLAADFRPFDFTDKYYEQNGVSAFALVDRVNGADGKSIFDYSLDPIHRDIRILATQPAYSSDGTALFWNYYAGVNKDGFVIDSKGGSVAVDLAFAYPLYVFPSTTAKNSDRQAAMLHIDDAYFKSNPLGIAAVMVVQFTDDINTPKGQIVMEMLAKRNGISLDGTPIIRNLEELQGLANAGLISLNQADPSNFGRASFAIAKALEHVDDGAITPDAFLEFVNQGGKPLDAEEHFLTKFECLKGQKTPCL